MSHRLRRPRPAIGDLITRLVAPIGDRLDRLAGWDRLPPVLGVFALIGVRQRLRERNLYDTRRTAATVPQRPSTTRTIDGRGNDPSDSEMGAAGMPFGRNAPPAIQDEESPSPLDVSNELLTRKVFFPAESINLLAAAWLQFEVHDWFAHRHDVDEHHLELSASMADGAHAEPPPLKRDPDVAGAYDAFVSDQTHWWDASQLYGAFPDFVRKIREGDGMVKEGDDLLRVMEEFTTASAKVANGTTPAVPNLWVGSALFHMLFAKEHNAICEELRQQYPERRNDAEWLFDKARLINAAIMAKIHTVEWTPAIIAHPTAMRGVKATWWGLLNRKLGNRFAGDEVLAGIPGSRQRHDGVPYSLTEEFVTVYRMHQLIPDEVSYHRVGNRSPVKTWSFAELAIERDHADRPREWLSRDSHSVADTIYSLAIAHPGEITLHNYPEFLQEFRPLDHGGRFNLGEIDIRRTRETGVPRYNSFRRLFRLPPAADFHEIANGNPQWAMEIKKVYGGKLENVDALIGMFAERKPKGFAFSETAFRVFVLMAARRLRSDRFFTTDYTPETYTPAGLARIERATLSEMLVRHHPELERELSKVDNPFQPWR